MRYQCLAMMAPLSLMACSMADDLPATNKAIDRFHQMVDAGRFEQVYDGSSADLKGASSKADFIKLLDVVHRKLGPFKTGKTGGWNNNYSPAGHFLTIGYGANYARGTADEQFVYRIDDGKAKLAGYHVNSNALIYN
ncbi:hypothetical protein ACVWZA_003409 [Sphingomonas sp. UYAg733]